MEPQQIHPPHEAFYIDSLLRLTFRAVQSHAAIQSWRKSLRSAEGDSEIVSAEAVLGFHEELLLAAGSISRYFWPGGREPKAHHALRARQLRRAFDVSDDSPLRNREIRNGLEHFDERLDDFLATFQAGEVIPIYIAPKSELGEIPVHIFRGVFTDTGSFVLLGKEYEVDLLSAELRRLYKALQSCCHNGFRLPCTHGVA